MSFARSLHEELNEPDDFDTSSGCGDMSFEFFSDMDNGGDSIVCYSPKNEHALRKLEFSGCDNNVVTPGPKNGSFSPPYKRVRALRLFDSPLTPKTIIQNCSSGTPIPRSRLFGSKPRAVPSAYAKREERPSANVNPFTPNGNIPSTSLSLYLIF